jgi:AAHS family benzoate transporter-like MFS transporter
VFLTGAFLFSAQELIYAAQGTYYLPSTRATALGWVSGMGRFGAVFGPWLGGVLVGHQLSGWGFGVFALAALLSAVLVALVRAKPAAAAPESVSSVEVM